MLHGLDIAHRHVILDGRPLGPAGPYEQLRGSARFRVDPAHPGNAAVVDLAAAPRDADGLVACRADLWILKPVDAGRGNGALFTHVVNRGRNGMLSTFQGAQGSNAPQTEAHFGDGLLLERGFTLAAVGWQADVPPHAEADGETDLLTLDVPVLAGVTGPVACEIVVDAPTDLHSLGSRYHHPYAWDEAHAAAAVLTVRDEPEGSATVVPRTAWSFDRLADGRAAVRFPQGFAPGRIYELVYTARDPKVMGLGFTVTRDLVAFLKHATQTPEGHANPLAGHLDRAHAFGSSQSGRFLRHFLRQGFNADEAGRRVFDGLFVNVAGAGQGSFNHRFAQPSRHASAHVDVHYPTEQFPFTDLPQADGATGATAGLLDACRAQGVTPRIVATNTSTEYWNRSGSLLHTDVDGTVDAPPHPDVRFYTFAGTQHGPGELPGSAAAVDAARAGQAPLPANPVDFRLAFRALALALDAWVRHGVEPPASAHPRIADGTLVPLAQVAWPALPGLPLPTHPRRARRLDWGPRFAASGIIDREPPTPGPADGVHLPQVDADGNELAGIRMPEVAVPLGTFTGWRYRTPAMGAPWALAGLAGQWVPVAATQGQADAAGDPRPPVTARYRDRADYVARCLAVGRDLLDRGLLLERDLPVVEARAARMYDLVAAPGGSP